MLKKIHKLFLRWTKLSKSERELLYGYGLSDQKKVKVLRFLLNWLADELQDTDVLYSEMSMVMVKGLLLDRIVKTNPTVDYEQFCDIWNSMSLSEHMVFESLIKDNSDQLNKQSYSEFVYEEAQKELLSGMDLRDETEH